MARKERDFQIEIRQSLRTLAGEKHYFKIPDAGFTNPYDAFLVYGGKFYALEYKISKSTTSIPLVQFFKNQPHELENLKRVRRCGQKAYIMINIWEPRKRNEILVLDPAQYDWLVASIAPKKSIKIDDPLLRRECLFIEKKDGVYDLNPMIVGESSKPYIEISEEEAEELVKFGAISTITRKQHEESSKCEPDPECARESLGFKQSPSKKPKEFGYPKSKSLN